LHELTKLRLLTAADLVGEQRKGALVLDVRPAESFALLHIRGAIQIGLGGPFSSWAAILLRPMQKIVIVAEDEGSAQEAKTRLERVGLGALVGYSLADELRWREQNIDLASISTAHCSDVRETLQRESSMQLVDVRSRAEWLRGHLPGAVSVPLLELGAGAKLMIAPKPAWCSVMKAFALQPRRASCFGKAATTSASSSTVSKGGVRSVCLSKYPTRNNLIDFPSFPSSFPVCPNTR